MSPSSLDTDAPQASGLHSKNYTYPGAMAPPAHFLMGAVSPKVRLLADVNFR